MALNNNALFRNATRLTQLFVGPRRFKADPTDEGARADRVRVTFKAAPGQSSDIVQVLDSNDAVLAKFDSAGKLTTPVTGDVTFTAGVTAIGAAKVLEAMLQAASAVGLGALRFAHMKYDFAVDGGVAGEIIPANSPTLPNKAIVLGGIVNVTTALLAAGGAANVSIGTHAGSAVDSIKVATAKATYALNALLATTPVFTAATAFKMSAAGQMSITPDTNNLTAGAMEVWAAYVVAS